MRQPVKITVAFATVYLVWGSTFLAIKLGIETMPPFLMMGIRFLVAGLVLLAVFGGARATLRANLRPLCVMALALVVLGTGVMAWVEHFVPSGIAALLVAISPLWLVFLESLMPLGRTPGGLGLLGVFTGLLGLILLISPDSLGGEIPWIPLGVLLLSSFCWSAGSIYGRHVSLSMPPMTATAWQMVIGGAVLLVLGLLFGEGRQLDVAAFSARSIVALLYLICFGSLLVFPAYMYLVRNVSPAKVGTHAYVNPVVALALGFLIADEPLNARTMTAALIILGSVLLIGLDSGNRRPKPRSRLIRLRRFRTRSA